MHSCADCCSSFIVLTQCIFAAFVYLSMRVWLEFCLVDFLSTSLLDYTGFSHKCMCFLTNRKKQYTAIGYNQSKLGNITCGVPQGSVLGPLLFILYVNDIHNAVPDVNILAFCR